MIRLLALVSLLLLVRSSPYDCGYRLDGIDDALSFTLTNNHHPRFTLMFWFQNQWKDKNSHIPQTIYSQGLDPPLARFHQPNDHMMRVIWSPESKLLIELKPYGILCNLEMTFQYERFYHFALSGGHNASMRVFVNGIDVNPICYKDVSLFSPVLFLLLPLLTTLFFSSFPLLLSLCPRPLLSSWFCIDRSGDREPCRCRKTFQIEDLEPSPDLPRIELACLGQC
jgi:hypothetical protein